MIYNKVQREVFRQIKRGNHTPPVKKWHFIKSTDLQVYINGVEVHSLGSSMFVDNNCYLNGGWKFNRLLGYPRRSKQTILKKRLRGEDMAKILPEDAKKDEVENLY